MRSRACCAPEVTMICSGEHRTPRDAPTYSAMARRRVGSLQRCRDHRASAELGARPAKQRAPKGLRERDRWPVRRRGKLCRWSEAQVSLPHPSEIVARVWRVRPSTLEEREPHVCALRTGIHQERPKRRRFLTQFQCVCIPRPVADRRLRRRFRARASTAYRGCAWRACERRASNVRRGWRRAALCRASARGPACQRAG